MAKVEDELRKMICVRYGSVLGFSKAIGVSNSTLATVMNRGVLNSNIDTIIKICSALGISVDELGKGNIVAVSDNLKTKEKADANIILGNAVGCLLNADKVVFDGKELPEDAVKDLVNLLTLDVEFLRKKMEK